MSFKGTILLSFFALAVAFATALAVEHGLPTPSVLALVCFIALSYGILATVVQRYFLQYRLNLSEGKAATAFFFALMPLALNIPYLWYRSGSASAASVDFLPNYLTIIAELMLGLALFIATVWLLADRKVNQDETHEDHPWYFLIPVAVVWTIGGSILSILMHHYMHEPGPNTTMVVQGFANILDERGPLFSNVLQAEGSSILGVHTGFIYFLLYPFYRVMPRYETLLVLGQIGMAAAVIPMYKLARINLSYRVSLLVALVYLANPVIAGSGPTQDMSELRFFAFPFLFSLYFFQKKKFWPFAAFAILAITIREDIGLIYLLLGVYALFTRRRWLWSLVPIAVGGAWFFIMTSSVIPYFNPAGSFTRLEVVYEEYGGSQIGLIKHLLLHPWVILQRMFTSASNIGLTYGLWQTTGLGVPIVSGMFILALPGFAELILLESGTRTSINSHHAVIIAVPLLAAMAYGLARLSRLDFRFMKIPKPKLMLLAATLILVSSISAFHVWFNPGRYQPRYNFDRANELLSQVPDDASLIVPMYLLVHTNADQKAVGYYQIAYRVDLDLEVLQEDYIIIDTNVPEGLAGLRLYSGLASLRQALAASSDYELVSAGEDLELYVRTQD